MKVLLSGNAEAETLRCEQTTLDRRDARNIISREERVFFARFGATWDGWGSNDQKTDYRDQGGARGASRRVGPDDGSPGGTSRRSGRSAGKSRAPPAPRRPTRARGQRRLRPLPGADHRRAGQRA